MDCKTVMDSLYDGCETTLLFRIQRTVHIFFCPECTVAAHQLEVVQGLVQHDFFPPTPDLADRIMAIICAEPAPLLAEEKRMVSFRGWVLAGFFMLLALASAYFGGDFLNIASLSGSSFMLPVGIFTGIALIAYGGIFIGTHLDDLSKRFGIGGK